VSQPQIIKKTSNITDAGETKRIKPADMSGGTRYDNGGKKI